MLIDLDLRAYGGLSLYLSVFKGTSDIHAVKTVRGGLIRTVERRLPKSLTKQQVGT